MGARRARRDPVTSLLSIVGVALVLSGLVAVDTVSAQAADPIELDSTWSDAFSLFESEWINQFADATRPVSVSNVLAAGDQFSKRNLIAGKQDFIVAGTRLTPQELATTTTAYAQIPVAVSSGSLMLRAPIGAGSTGWSTRVPGSFDDPITGEETVNPLEKYNGALKLNPELIIGLIAGEAFELAAQEAFKNDNNRLPFVSVGGARTAAISRVDPGALPKHMRSYFAAMTPQTLAKIYVDLKIDPTGLRPEEWPFLAKATRSNNASLVNAFVQSVTPDAAPAAGGMLAVFDTVNADAAKAKYPTVDLRTVEIKNAAGSWVAPTKQNVLAGIAAGVRSGDPAETFVEDVASTDVSLTTAYPLTWLQWLIVPTTGLSAEKANAVAMIVRFLVTAGQDDLDKGGVPRLPQPLVTSALASADGLVRSNCTDEGFRVATRSDPGPLAPAALKLPAGTSIAYCEAIPVTTTTTTTTTAPPTSTTDAPTPTTTTEAPAATTTTTTAPPSTTTTTTIAGASSADDVPVNVLPSTITRTFTPTEPAVVAPSVTPGVPTAPTETPAPAATPNADSATEQPPEEQPGSVGGIDAYIEPIAVTLPSPPPLATRQQFDRVSTMGMGGACLIAAVRRRRKRAAT